MLYRSPEHKIRDVKAVHDEVAHHVVPRKTEKRPFGRNLLLLLADFVVRLGKFLLQPVADRRMQPKFLRVIVQVEDTAYIVSFPLKRVDGKPHLVIQLVEYPRHKEAEYERSKHEQNARSVSQQIEHARGEQNREGLHNPVTHRKEPVD